ncbi:solute carrier family 25 member 53-like [Denticeps clupeoides]|uniref:solute carrier family 25 member 53-like n=1 Tax=Denticeps clupeoides TaxID=299321 RepID=UPI0010A46D57|nr:solute carrier family 25 member 53 [Denticeps clupeoides]
MGRSPGAGEKEDASAMQSRSYVHGGLSGLVATVVTFPVHKTLFRQQLHSALVREAVLQLRKEGPVKLYRGVAPPLAVRTLQGAFLFGLQGTLLQRIAPLGERRAPPVLLQAVAGVGTGAVEALMFAPFERVQNVLQNERNHRTLPTLRSIISRLKSQTPAKGFYRGLTPILVRNSVGSGLYFGLKNPVRDALSTQGFSPVVSSFLSGVLNSVAISLPLYPLSVLVANMQARVGGDGGGVRACARGLWRARQRSVARLYRGGTLVILRSCISWGITTAVYDYLEKNSTWLPI